MKVFYTTQFENSVPYLYQLQKVFPFALGPINLILLVPALAFFSLKSKNRAFAFILIFTVACYFLYFGQLYTKWFRFMSPLFILPPLVIPLFLSKTKKVVSVLLCVFCLLPGILFSYRYFIPDIRLVASSWIENNIPENSVLLSEGGNVVDIPLTTKPYQLTNFDFFTLEQNITNREKLIQKIVSADYILVPSRRVFANQKGENYPISQSYYQALFSGSLGFIKIKQFSVFQDIFMLEKAEETVTVFDNPTIRIYKKINQLTPDQIDQLLHI
jgi:hypothetical protein